MDKKKDVFNPKSFLKPSHRSSVLPLALFFFLFQCRLTPSEGWVLEPWCSRFGARGVSSHKFFTNYLTFATQSDQKIPDFFFFLNKSPVWPPFKPSSIVLCAKKSFHPLPPPPSHAELTSPPSALWCERQTRRWTRRAAGNVIDSCRAGHRASGVRLLFCQLFQFNPGCHKLSYPR